MQNVYDRPERALMAFPDSDCLEAVTGRMHCQVQFTDASEMYVRELHRVFTSSASTLNVLQNSQMRIAHRSEITPHRMVLIESIGHDTFKYGP